MPRTMPHDSLLTRRRILGMGAAALASVAASRSFAAIASSTKLTSAATHIPIGYTGITFRNTEVPDAIAAVATNGFYGFETFGDVLEKAEPASLKPVLDSHKLPLISGYCTMNLVDTAKRKDEVAKAINWSKLIKKNGGRIFVLGPNQVDRDHFKYADHKADIVSALNEYAQAVHDQGLTPVLHQHTGTCVMTRDETYATLDAVNTRVLKFGPDVGQLTKGGQDALEVVKHYLPLVQHMHLKDFAGTDNHLLGYCPLGQGKVDVPGILNLMAGRKISGMVMVELDNDFKDPSPTPPAQLVAQSHDYLKSIGVRFRT